MFLIYVYFGCGVGPRYFGAHSQEPPCSETGGNQSNSRVSLRSFVISLFPPHGVLTTRLRDDRKCDALTATLATLRQRAAEIGSPNGGTGDRDRAHRRIIDKTLSADEAVMSAEPMAIDGDLPATGILGARAAD
jgi:hypothetical protein